MSRWFRIAEAEEENKWALGIDTQFGTQFICQITEESVTLGSKEKAIKFSTPEEAYEFAKKYNNIHIYDENDPADDTRHSFGAFLI